MVMAHWFCLARRDVPTGGVRPYGVYRLWQHMEQVLVWLKHVEPYLVDTGVLAVFAILGYLLR